MAVAIRVPPMPDLGRSQIQTPEKETMKSRTVAALVALSVAAGVAHADPYAINQVTAGSTNYAFFLIKAKKIRGTMAQATLDLANALAPYGVSPCVVNADADWTIVCGNPATPTFMLPVPNEFFTYDLAF